MRLPRSSGVLLHPTSLPSPHGIGDLGPEAYRFADFLSETGQRIWQVLPLGPTGHTHSPYQSYSAFAGNPLLVSLPPLVGEGLLDGRALETAPAFTETSVDYEAVTAFQEAAMRHASRRFHEGGAPHLREEYDRFCAENASWLDDYALFRAVKEVHGGAAWHTWDAGLVRREPDALRSWQDRLRPETDDLKFQQFLFFRQWRDLRNYCRDRGIVIMGDIPIYVAHDSSDVWSHPDLFDLDETGAPTVVAGVPPDYFSATGQYWGNPIYRWDVMAARGYAWWIDRIRSMLSMMDILRIDHFRGFEAYWVIPAAETTAVNGHWEAGPRDDLFHAIQNALGTAPLVAENLGLITDEVEALRKRFEFPGMGVLQFAFGPDIRHAGFLPHQYYPNLVAYTGTHDNDTFIGWWQAKGEGTTMSRAAIRQERDFARRYMATTGKDIHWVGIRVIMASVADTAVFPLQDILGLGSEARMNTPGTSGDHNWRWRFRTGALTPDAGERLREMTELYGRLPDGR